MAGWEEPDGPSRGGALGFLREAARVAAVAGAALAAGVGLLLAIAFLAPMGPPGSTLRGGVAATSPSPSSSATPAATLPPLQAAPVPPAPPPPGADAGPPDQYLGDLTSDRSANSGGIDGVDYAFTHGFGMSLDTSTREQFVVPAGYRSLTASLKAVGGTIRFSLLAGGGQPVFQRTLSPYQPPVTITCATPPGSTVVLAALFEGGGSLVDAVAVWGDARFSTSPAPAAGCS